MKKLIQTFNLFGENILVFLVFGTVTFGVGSHANNGCFGNIGTSMLTCCTCGDSHAYGIGGAGTIYIGIHGGLIVVSNSC